MFLKDQPFSKMAPPLPNPGSATDSACQCGALEVPKNGTSFICSAALHANRKLEISTAPTKAKSWEPAYP